MKRVASFLCCLCIVLSLCSCSKASDVYGVWYNDSMGVRNAIQFSENRSGEDVFAWAVKDIKSDTEESRTVGFYRVSGDSIIFDPDDGTEPYTLSFRFEDGALVLFSETTSIKFLKYTLEG